MNGVRVESGHILDPSEFEIECEMDKEVSLSIGRHKKNRIIVYRTNFKFKDQETLYKFYRNVEKSTRLMHPALLPLKYFNYPKVESDGQYFVFDGNPYYTLHDIIQYKKTKWTNTKRSICILGILTVIRYLNSKDIHLQRLLSKDILVDKNLHPKIWNYLQLPASNNLNTKYKARNPPESDKMSEKSDVYRFGIITLDIISDSFVKEKLFDIPNVKTNFQKMIQNCLMENPEDRPTLSFIINSIIDDAYFCFDDVNEAEFVHYKWWLSLEDKYRLDGFMDLSDSNKELIHNSDINAKATDCDLPLVKRIEYDIMQNDSPHKFLSVYFAEGICGFPKNSFAKAYYMFMTHKIDHKIYHEIPKWYIKRLELNEHIKNKSFHICPTEILEYDQQFLVPSEHREKLSSSDPNDHLLAYNSYLNGLNGFPNNIPSALLHLKIAANKCNNQDALELLAKHYISGDIVPENTEKALDCLKLIKNPNNSQTKLLSDQQRKINELNNEINQMPKENKTIYNLANSGEINHLLSAAFGFFTSTCGFPLSKSIAYKLYRQAAKKSAEIECLIANFYRVGKVFPKHLIRARKHFKQAALRGSRRAKMIDNVLRKHLYSCHHYLEDELKSLTKNFLESAYSSAFDITLLHPTIHFLGSIHHPFINSVFEIVSTSLETTKKKRRKNPDHYIMWSISNVPKNYLSLSPQERNETAIQCNLLAIAHAANALEKHGVISSNLGHPELSFNATKYFEISHYQPSLKQLKLRTTREDMVESLGSYLECIIKDVNAHYEITNFIGKIKTKEITDFEQIAAFFENNWIEYVFVNEFEKFVDDLKYYEPEFTQEIFISPQMHSKDPKDQIFIAKSYFDGMNKSPINYRESAKYYKLAADNGSPEAQCMFALMSANGLGTPQSVDQAIKYYEMAINLGYDEAKYRYSLFLSYIIPKVENLKYSGERYDKMLRVIAESGHSEAQFAYGRLLESDYGKYDGKERAIKYYRMAADQGHLEALKRIIYIAHELDNQELISHYLPVCSALYQNRFFLKLAQMNDSKGEYKTAIAFINMAIKLKSKRAKIEYAHHLARGHGVDVDYEKAIQIYRENIDKEDALLSLSEMYKNGIGVKKSLTKAIKVFIQAQNLLKTSDRVLSAFAALLEEYDPKYSFELWHRIADKKQEPEALYQTALSFLNGRYCTKDTTVGMMYLQQAVKKNHPDAIYLFGKINFKNKNINEGLFYIKKSAVNMESIDGQYYYGKLLYKGMGIEEDFDEAFKYLYASATKGNIKAMYLLSKPVFYYMSKISNIEILKCLNESASKGYKKSLYLMGMKLLKGDEMPQDVDTGYNYIKLSAKQNYKKAINFLNLIKKKGIKEDQLPLMISRF